MKYVTMPAPIQLVDPKSGAKAQEVSLKEYATSSGSTMRGGSSPSATSFGSRR